MSNPPLPALVEYLRQHDGQLLVSYDSTDGGWMIYCYLKDGRQALVVDPSATTAARSCLEQLEATPS